MNALTDQRIFASAYRQLRPVERIFVDDVVQEMERTTQRANERISAALHRPITVTDERGMLEKPMVRAAIVERINEIAAATELTVQRVIKEYVSIAFSNIANYQTVNEFGELVFDISRCTPEEMSAVKSIRIKEPSAGIEATRSPREFSFTMHDKMEALKQLVAILSVTDPENPHWRNGGLNAPAITVDTTETAAADAYAALIG